MQSSNRDTEERFMDIAVGEEGECGMYGDIHFHGDIHCHGDIH